jgi:hypothetical protein
MATPAPIYASSPGLLVSKNPATTQVVLIPPASTIAGQLIVRDASGTASLANPIVVSTTQGALFTGGASTFYISDPYSAFATAALSPSLYMPLYASSFQPIIRYGTESNFTPQYQYISSAYNPASFNALSSTALYGTLVNGAPLFTTADPDFRFQAQSLSTGHLSTADLTVDARYTAGSAATTSSYSAYLSAGVGLLSSLTTDSMTVSGRTVLQSTLRTTGSLQVGGNFSMAGPAVFADVSANGYWSTLGTIGVGGDVSGATVDALTSTIVGGGAYSRGAYFVSAATVAATLSTVLASASTAVYSAGLGVGITPGTALSATLDVSGGASVSNGLTASGISTIVLSSATAVMSSATLRDINTPYSAYDLKVQGGQLFVGGTALGGGGGGVSAEFVGNSFTASNFLYGTSTITSTFTVGSTIVNPDFDVAVYGSAHSSSIFGDNRKSTLWVAVGSGSTMNTNYTLGARASIKYSWNGSNNWSNINSGAGFINGQDVAWNGKIWVAVGNVFRNFAPISTGNPRSTIQWSLDGSNWNNCLAGGGFNGTAGGLGISWNGKMWIATGHDASNNFTSTIQYSYNGSNFQAVQSANNFLDGGTLYSSVTFRAGWNGSMWIAGRSSSGNAASNACYSYDGLNWSNLTISTIVGPVSHVNWNGRYWLAAGSAQSDSARNTSIAISSNGFNWISSINAPFGGAKSGFNPGRAHCHNSVWTGDRWVAIGVMSTSCIAVSFNGLNWIDVAPNDANRNFIFDDFQTDDFQTQLNYYLPRTAYNYYGGGRGLVWNGRLFVAVGFQDGDATRTSTIRYSTDLITWTSIPSNGFGFNGLGYGGAAGGAYNGNAIAWQSNCQTDISLPGQDIITSRTQQTYASTTQIYSLSSLVTFGQTLFVDSSRQTAINTYYSSISTQYLFFVDGSMLTYGAAKQGGAATWTAVSDERVKQDIVNADISACYHALRDLHVHNYKYKDSYIQKYNLPSKPRYGLYAEEVEQVIPEAVLNTNVLGEQVKMLDMEPVNMLHYGATSYLYSTLKHHTSTIAGGHTYITAAGPLQDISGAFHTSYANRPALLSNLTELFTAHASNYQ